MTAYIPSTVDHGKERPPPFSLLDASGLDIRQEIEYQYQLGIDLIEDVYPCTPMQEGLFALDRKPTGDNVMHVTLEFAPGVSLEAFCAAWDKVVRITPILRTRIVHQNALGLLQVVLREPIQWLRVDRLQDDVPEDELIRPGFGQELSRYTIIEQSNGQRRFDLRIHYALCDGWSLSQVISMVNCAYRGGQLSEPQGFNCFVKYTLAQNSQESRQYWQSELGGNEIVHFPAVPSSHSGSVGTARVQHRFRKPETQPLGITQATAVLAAWALVAACHTGSSDIGFGTTVSGRDAQLHGIATIIGPTTTTVPVRVQIDRTQRISTFLEDIQRQSFRRIPFEQLGRETIAEISEHTRHACTFQTVVAVQPDNDDQCTDSLVGRWQTESKDQTADTYGLMLRYYFGADDVSLEATFNPQAIDEREVLMTLERTGSVIRQLAESTTTPAKTVAEIDMLTAGEVNQIFKWNSPLPTAEDRCVHELIQDQTTQSPNVPAICAWDGELTYAELDKLSTRLAHHLSTNFGIGPEVIVPICFRKSIWTAVAMLGILKAGGAFVPIDPSQAPRRREILLGRVNAHVVLASENYAESGYGPGRAVISVSRDTVASWGDASPAPLHRSTAQSPISPAPSSAAYVIFTSGSTGEPKGVVIEHQSVSTSCRYNGALMGFTASTRTYQFAAYTFDVSIQEILITLLYGGCVCIPSEEDRLSRISESMNLMEVNLTLLTPSIARLIKPSAVPKLRTIILGGEKLSKADINQWDSERQLYVTYGPSECAISCMTGRLETDISAASKPGYIGTPIGCVSWIVDPQDHSKLVPIGVPGELLIEGPVVGREYLHDHTKTVAGFIEDATPWLTQVGRRGRLYKTGDLVRYNQDGSLMFVGRKDMQVKLRGQRVELGEVEHHFRECMSDASQVAAEVIVLKGKTSKPMLAAFICRDIESARVCTESCNGAQITAVAPEVQEQLADRLPAYMVPDVCFILAAMPTLTSGKTDRQRLREIGASFSAQKLAELHRSRDAGQNQPVTELQIQVQKLWARVLNISAGAIGLDDNFFHLGGDSITAMQVSSAARANLLNIPTAEVLRKKTIRRIVSETSNLIGPHTYPPMVDEPAEGPFPLSPIQKLWLQLQPDATRRFDQCFLLRLARSVSPSSVRMACEAVIDHHPMLRARFQHTPEDTWEQFISKGDENASLYGFQHVRGPSDSDMVKIIAQSRDSLDIEHGPLLMAVLFDEADGQNLFLTIHHLVVDLVSWRILLQDLEEMLNVGSISDSPGISFQTWCALQADFAASQPVSDYALSFTPRPPMLNYWGVDAVPGSWEPTKSQTFQLDKDVTARILGSCNDAFDTRPVELSLAALISSFGHVFSDRQVPPIFCEGHGREAWDSNIELSRTTGWFTTTFPVQLDAGAEASMLDTIRQTKDCIRSFKSNGWLYFATKFLDEHTMEFMSYFPAEIAFNYVGAYQQLERADALFEMLSLPDGSSSESPSGITLFDITVAIEKHCLSVTFTYPQNIQRQTDITSWLKQYETTLIQMSDQLPDRDPEWTLADFPLVFKKHSDLDEFRDNYVPALGSLQLDEIKDIYPCSAMQEGILISQAKSPENYRAALLLEVTSFRPGVKIDSNRLRQAWVSVVQRHDLLRAYLVDTIPGSFRPAHIVLERPEPCIEVLHNGDSVDSVEAFRQRYCPNSYERGGLQHYVTLCGVADDDVAYLYIEMNHVISDGHSQSILLRDLQKAYNGNLDPVAPSYKDFISYLAKQPYDDARQYWTEHLAGVEPCYFPVLRDSSQKEEVGHRYRTISVPDLDNEQIRAFCSKHDVTAATIVQAAWAMVLGRYSGSTMPCFGNLSSGRDLPFDGADEIFGPLIGMLTCRVDLAAERSVIQLLQDVQEDTLESLRYQTFPLADVHAEMNLGAFALFNSGISFQKTTNKGDAETEDIRIDYVDLHDPTEYDIHVNATMSDAGLEITMGYSAEIMTNAQEIGVAESMSVAISCLTNQPHRSIRQLDIMGPSDRQRLWKWNAYMPAAIERCVHELINDHTTERPEAQSIYAWDGELTYSELDKLSTRLACYLAAIGVRQGVYVPLCFEKSMWVVVAILAVLKAGGAFVPLDPSQAPVRRERLLGQTKAHVVVTSAKYANLLFGDDRIVVPVAAQNVSSWTEIPPTLLAPLEPSAIAYMIFTSGSTGEPKGVVIEHRSVSSSCWAMGHRVGFSRASRVLQFAAYTFDASLMDILTTLAFGGCVCIPSEDDRLINLGNTINTMGVNLAFLTPSIARTIEPSGVSGLTTLVLGGEKVSNGDYVRWKGQRKLLNGYGPTECAIGCMVNTMSSETIDQACIGKAIGSVSWIVDPGNHNNLLPVGIVGELLIEGPIVGRGYHCRPDRTAEVFIQDPCWLTQGVPETPRSRGTTGRRGRLYKTGDLARYNDDGSVSYIGRKDNQVKIRGQRVELGEIEHQVRDCLHAPQAAAEVITPAGEGSTVMLAAFICMKTGHKHPDTPPVGGAWAQADEANGIWVITVSPAMEDKLGRHLPGYMVPAVYFGLATMPMTMSGKIDRVSLRKIGASFSVLRLAELRSISGGKKREPVTDVERRLQQLWSQTLDINPSFIGLDDSFFLLGGQSIAAMRLVAAARLAGLQFSVADVFRYPRLSSLAGVSLVVRHDKIEHVAHFSLLSNITDASSICASIAEGIQMDAAAIEDIYPCTPLQEGLVALSAKGPGDYVLQKVLHLSDVNLPAFKDAWEQVIQSTPILRTRIVQNSHVGLVQVVCKESIHWTTTSNLDEYLLEDRYHHMGLGRPLVRYALIDNGSSPETFVWTIHHALYDAWSFPRVLELVEQAYHGKKLPQHPNFNTFIKYLTEHSDASVEAYWRSKFADRAPEVFPTLPVSVQEPKADSTAELQVSLPELGKTNITLSNFVRAGWGLVLYHYTNSTDVVFGAILSGRNAPVVDVENIIGPTIATVPVLIQIDPQQSTSAFMHEVQDLAIGMIPYEQTGLQQIAKLDPATQQGCNFQTLLVVQPPDNGQTETNSLGEWQVTSDMADFSSYALTLHCAPDRNGLKLTANFDSRVVESWLINKMLKQLCFTMQQLAQGPQDRKLGELQALTPADGFVIWSRNTEVPSLERCTHDLISEQMVVHAKKQAVCAYDGELTYAELDKWSTRLARRLKNIGVGPESFVPLFFEKSLWTVVAMLGVLKAGGAFVPFDPAHSARGRQRLLLDKTNATVVLTSAQYEKENWYGEGRVVVAISLHHASLWDDALPVSNTASPTPSSAACLLFTSGSTGEPKGVVIEHRALSSSCWAHGARVGFDASSRVLEFATYTFDTCLMEVMTTLLYGGCVCVASEKDRLERLEECMTSMGVNLTFFTPSVARLLNPARVPTLQTLILGGERVNQDDVQPWQSREPPMRVFNGYGPTECTVFAVMDEIRPALPIQIGKPVGSVSWIVDPKDHNKLLPIGAVGELLIDGPIVGREYLHNPDRTAAAFINDPIWLLQGSPIDGFPGRHGRLYRTGDLARYNQDGSLSYIGRADNQTKIRGQRIELGEVEHCLKECMPHARDIVAEIILPLGDSAGPILAAFICAAEASQMQDGAEVVAIPPDVESKVADRLPGYMMPRVYFSLAALPTTTSAKIDRKRLREVGATFSDQQLAEMRNRGEKRQPTTGIQRQLQQLWASVLKVTNTIGIDDSFFFLGGDSIAAMKLVAEARTDGLVLSVADVFRHPKLEQLALVSFRQCEKGQIEEHVANFSLIQADTDASASRNDIANRLGVDASQIEDIYPCTPLQEGLLALTAKQPGAYVLQTVLRIASNVDLEAFRAAWEYTVRSTPVLRTQITQHDHIGLLQVVMKGGIQWTQTSNLDNYLKQDQSLLMGIDTPLARYALINDEWTGQKWFVWTVHHALYDGWSFPQILKTAQHAYCGAQLIRQPSFSLFVRHIMAMNNNDGARKHWETLCAGRKPETFPPLSAAMHQDPRPDTTLEHDCLATCNLGEFTVSTIVRAAWAMILHHHTNSADVAFGATVTGRNAPVAGIEDILGPTIATVPILLRVRLEQSINSFLNEVQRLAVNMIPYEQTGLQQIMKYNDETAQCCRFQSLLVIQPTDEEVSDKNERHDMFGQWHSTSGAESFSSYALTLSCYFDGERLRFVSMFDSDVIEPWLVRNMLSRMEFLVQALAGSAPDTTLDEIGTLSAVEQDQIWTWNSNIPEAIDRCVHELVHDQVLKTPDAPAISAWDGDLTYAELDGLSSRLAQHLATFGVGPDFIVPLCFEKSKWAGVTMLAVLKAGGAFVMLDPSLPKPRLRSMVAQTMSNLLLSSIQEAATCSGFAETVIPIGSNYILSLAESNHLTLCRPNSSSTAYVVFTSGSTGTPKGVLVTHKSFASAIVHQSESLGFKSSVRSYDFSSYAFDLSREIFFTLATGGCLCVPSESDRKNNLTGSLVSTRAELLHLTPSVARMLDREKLVDLRVLILGGEAAKKEDLSDWPEGVSVRVTYGPSECTPTSTIKAYLEDHDDASNIGFGVGTVSWVVDADDCSRLLPVGAVGELLLEGPLVGPGYLHDPTKTASAFVESPPWLKNGTSNHPGRHGRLYKTGDLVRYSKDGTLIYVGRKDTQVKINGQRVELGEVEYHVQAGVQAPRVVVDIITPSNAGASPLLAAFVEQSPGQAVQRAPDEEAVALVTTVSPTVDHYLTERLPAYMIPAVFFTVRKLPLNTSGKLDRYQLRNIGASFSTQQLMKVRGSPDKQVPSTPTELALQQIWARILHIDQDTIGANDSFFHLGGDSIAAMRFVADARRVDIMISVADVFRHPQLSTLAHLSPRTRDRPADQLDPFALLGDASVKDRIAAACNLDAQSLEDAYPCTPLQEGLLSLTSKSAGAYTARTVLALSDHVDMALFCRSWEEVARRLPILRTRIQNTEFGLIQVVMNENIQWSSGTVLDTFIEQDSADPMSIGSPLSRYAIIKNEQSSRTWFVWTVHHSLYDGQFLGRIPHQVNQIYNGASGAVFKDFKYFVKYLTSVDTEITDAYWRSSFEGYDSAPFPTPSLAVETVTASSVVERQFRLPPITGANVTVASLTRAAWALTIAAYCGPDVVFGSTVTGRNADLDGIENIAGPTIATVPIRIQIPSGQATTISTYIHQVQDQFIEMIPHEQAGLQKIRQVSPEARRACQFHTLLVIQPNPEADIEVLDNSDLGRWTSDKEVEHFATYPLNLYCVLTGEGVNVEAIFDPAVVDHWTVESMLERLGHVMHQFSIDSPEKTLAEVEMVAPRELEQIWRWNNVYPTPVDRCIHDLVLERVQAQGAVTAVHGWDGQLTYGELDDLASRLAHHLVALGVVEGTLVPFCFEKSIWTVVATLAVLMVGGAIVPLDPSQSADRRERIVAQTGASIVLTSVQYSGMMTQPGRIVVPVCGQSVTDKFPMVPDALLAPVSSRTTAYVIFTSGSTGQPKGVVIDHRANTTSCMYIGRRVGLGTQTRALQFSSHTFDVSILEIFATLAHGGCVCVPSDSERLSGLEDFISSTRVNLAIVTPTVSRLLDPRRVPSLRTIILGGETCEEDVFGRWRHHSSVFNGYGPTECTMCSLHEFTSEGMPYGYSIGTAEGSVFWVVAPGDTSRLVPIGTVGELLIEGPVLTQGYLNDPAKTLAAFVDDPPWLLRGVPGHYPGRQGRLYRSGDLVRYDKHGRLVYLGRQDTQVKIRGQRVELGEVEYHVMVSIPGVKKVVAEVITSNSQGASLMLAVFLVMDGSVERGSAPQVMGVPAPVEDQLRERLPKYMIPDVYFTIDELPMNSSGKTDRQRLRGLGASFSPQQLAEVYNKTSLDKRVPSTTMELALQHIWAQILNIDTVIGVDDNFFHLGGDSIAAMKLAADARRANITLSVADVFQNPRLSALALAALSPRTEKRPYDEVKAFAILGDDTSAIQAAIAAACNVETRLIGDAYPCTPMQKGLLSMTSQSTTAYTARSVLALSDHIDIDLFRHAWEEVVRMLPILRSRVIQDTRFGLVQAVVDEDIQWTSGSDLHSFLEQDAANPVGLGQSLSRYALVTENGPNGTKRAWFVWTIHHAAYDGYFLSRIPELVNQIYRGLPSRTTFQDFRYFARYLAAGGTAAIDSYWQSAFVGYDSTPFPAPPPLPSSVATTTNCLVERQLVVSITRPIVTIATLVRAAWALTMAACSGSNDVVFGATVSGRYADIANIEDIAGPTIATVPVRVQITSTETVSTYLRRVQEQTIEMIPYEQAGLQRIREVSDEANKASQFQTLLIVQPQEDAGALNKTEFGTWTSDRDIKHFATYALNIICNLYPEGAKIEAVFDESVLSSWVMEAILERLGSVVDQLASAAPDQTVAEIDILSATDYERLWEWNGTVPMAVEDCAHSMVEKQAATRPSAQAICAWDGELTYHELDELATRLAHHLISLGVGGTMVPLCFEKTQWAIVAMLGVMKAGCAFVPLDASQATDRREWVFSEIDAKVVLASTSHAAMLAGSDRAVIRISADSMSNFQQSPSTTTQLWYDDPSSTAYAIFTSGSTGQPKGVVVDHRALSTSCLSHGRAIAFNQQTRALQFTSYAFDVSIMEILTTLIYGGCICIPSDEERLNTIEDAINSMEVNLASLTPSIARLVQPSRVPSLDTIVLGGERATEKDFEKWSHLLRRVNGYGPTECTIFSSLYDVEADDASNSGSGSSNIGKAIGSVSWIVSPGNANQLVPIGTVGELLVEGPILSRGYLNDPEKTSSAFIEDPPWLLRGAPGHLGRRGRLYKTGDLVKYNKDGSIIYLGRQDTQVKIRGQRVELGEVEHYVRECVPRTQQVVAEVILPREGATPILAAFLVLEDSSEKLVTGVLNESPKTRLINIHSAEEDLLAERLPAYMIPRVYFALDKIPMNLSGKTVHKLLREIGSGYSIQELSGLGNGSNSKKRAPGTGLEQTLQQIWARVLNIESATIGVDDNFFRLGGDSITAMQVSAAARSSQVDILTADILRKQTISRLAASVPLSKQRASHGKTSAQDDDGQPFGLSPIQQLYTQLDSDPTKCFDQNFFLRLRKAVSFVSITQALETIVLRHPMLRARFSRTTDGAWEQHVTPNTSSSFYLQDATSKPCAGPEQAGILRECREKLDIERGPVVAAVLFKDGNECQSLFITIHHLVIDLMSWRILLQDLEELLTLGPSSSPSPTTSFRTWRDLQAQYVSESLDCTRTDSLESPRAPLLYWGVDCCKNVVGATAAKQFILDGPTSASILGSCNDAYRTRPMELMVAALIHSFQSVFSDRHLPSIYSEGHGREIWDDSLDLTRTVGWFTTIFPVNSSQSHGTLLDTVRQTKDFIRKLSKNGWSHFTSRFAGKNQAVQNAQEYPVEVLLNFAGSYQQLERGTSFFEHLPLPDGSDPASMAGVQRFSLFDILVGIQNGQLAVSVIYPKQSHHQERINVWVDQYQSSLKQLASVLPRRSQEWTLSDFPMAFSSYEDIDEWQTRLLPQLPTTKIEDIEDVYPCTPMQENILFAQRKNPQSYRVVLELEIPGIRDIDDIEQSKIKQAWKVVVQRHALLRTILVEQIRETSRTMHVVMKDPAPNVSFTHQANGNTNIDKQAAFITPVRYSSDGLQHYLSVSQGNEKGARLRLELNHVIIDGFSINILLHDFRLAYSGSLDANGPLYGDFVSHVEQQLRQADYEFWPRYLANVEPCLFPTSNSNSKSISTFTVDVDEIDATEVHNFCAKYGVTTATVIQAAWALVLYHCTGSTLPIFGVLTSGRDVPVDGVIEMLGPLISLIPCRVRLDKTCSVLEALRTIQKEYAECLPHQTYALTGGAEKPHADTSCLFNTALSFQKGKKDSVVSDDENTIQYRGGQDPVEYDIYIRALDGAGYLGVLVEFWEGRISMAEGRRVAKLLSDTLSAIIAGPERDIRSVNVPN